MPYINCNELDIYYEEFGRGETILFLHSHFSRGLLAFSGQILPFSGKYRCIIPDFRGHGRTICDNLEWSSRIIADDMINFLDKLGIEKAHLIGYSCGAYVACYMASKYPDRVKCMITIGGGAYPRANGAEDFLPENLIKNGELDFIEDMKVRHFEAHKGNWEKYLQETVKDWKEHPNLSEEEWRKIKCKTLFINGEMDPFGTVKELQEKVPHAEVFEVKESGHRPHFVGEKIDIVNKRILDFLERNK